MKSYNSIPYWSDKYFGQNVIAFDKIDGSNLRFEWSKKRGFYKFGTRTQMITEHHPHFGEGVDLFMEKYSEDLERVFTDEKDYRHSRLFVVFCEYFGDNSFAGWHDPDDEMDVVLIDVHQFKHGIIPSKQFLKNFGHLHVPEVVYEGPLDSEFVVRVKQNFYGLKEGVVAKGSDMRKGKYYSWMVKIKTREWLDKVKNKLGQERFLEETAGNTSMLDI